jgi:hypothetical protein
VSVVVPIALKKEIWIYDRFILLSGDTDIRSSVEDLQTMSVECQN